VIGGVGVLFGLMGLVLIREPSRGKYDIDMRHENPKVKAKE